MVSAAMMAQRARVTDLYRRSLREIPRVIAVFDLDQSEAEIHSRVRMLFRKHDGVTDPRLVDQLLILGENHLQETMEIWKQKSHLSRLLGYDTEDKPTLKQFSGESDFLKNFYGPGHQ